jgi:hypothetical protein
MQQVFLSYTFKPHPDYAESTAKLRKMVGMVIDSMELREANGEDLGGLGLSPEVKARIEASDALVALVTPHHQAGGALQAPPWVQDEYAWAIAKDHPGIKIVHADLKAGVMFAGDEHIAYADDTLGDTLVKLMRTLALWKRTLGRPTQIVLDADAAGFDFDIDKDHACEYQLLSQDFKKSVWQPASIWPEPGALNAFVRGVPDMAKLRLRLTVDKAQWLSEFQSPMGRVVMTKVKP